jgi:kynureninase
LEAARQRDAADELAGFRDLFVIPPHDGGSQIYFCGHSLGLQPRAVESAMQAELAAWRDQAVAGHFKGEPAWIDYHDVVGARLAPLVGADPAELAVMNSLTVNLHLMMVSFYRPRGRRRKIVIEQHAFPSDRYAVQSQIRCHGLDPAECLLELEPEPGGRRVEESSVERLLAAQGDEIALVLWPGVQYASGQAFDLRRIAAAGRAAGARVGFDLAHSVGNLPLALHDSGCDFAVWCTYKYLNGGPGSVAGCFVHERHHGDTDLPRFEGWWGNARDSRFRMDQGFDPAPGAEAWVLSNPPVLALVPLRVSLDIFAAAGMAQLRGKSLALTSWLLDAIDAELADVLEVITPRDPERRGSQLSLRVRAGRDAGQRLYRYLGAQGVVTDWREPDVIRVAPAALYNRFEECFELLRHIADWSRGRDAAG